MKKYTYAYRLAVAKSLDWDKRKVSKNFRAGEFNSKDGGGYCTALLKQYGTSPWEANKRRKKLAEYCEQVRKKSGNKPLTIHSGLRTISHNKAVGGEPNSAHLYGYAVDITVKGVSIATLHRIVRSVFPSGVGKYNTFIHGDFSPTLGYRNW